MLNEIKPLKIAFDAKRAFNNSTGLGNYARFVIRSLVEYYPQHSYYLFTPKVSRAYDDFLLNCSNVHRVTPQSIAGKIFPSLWRTYAISNICNQLGIDVYWGLSNELPLGIQQFKGKKIVTIHDLIFLRYPRYYNLIDRFIYQRKFSYATRVADQIVAASNQTAHDLVTYFATPRQKIQTVYQDCNSIFRQNTDEQADMAVLSKLQLQKQQYILCVGTIESRKNQEVVLQAFHKASFTDMKLVFVGRKTSYASKLMAYINTYHLSDQVVFMDALSHQDLPALYRMAYVSVYASRFEGFGIPILEAMRCGVPVIAAATSSLVEVGGEACSYFSADDVQELTRLLVGFTNPQLREAVVGKGLAQAALFNTEAIVGQLAGMLNK